MSKTIVSAMRAAFFEISKEDILVYVDPAICQADTNAISDFTSSPIAALPLSVTVVSGAGTAGSDRVVVILPDHFSANSKWLRVVVKSNVHGGKLDLLADDVFYVGWAKGEAGSVGGGFALVNATDVNYIKLHLCTSINPTVITDPADNTKDGLVNTTDANDALLNLTTSVNGLVLITAP